MLPTLPRPGPGLQTVPGTGLETVPGTGHALLPARSDGPGLERGVFADAVARWRGLERLREFRSGL